MSLIHLKNVQKSYGTQNVLKNVSLLVNEGEQVVITGPSGSGKSTLLYLLGGLDRPDGGDVIVQGQALEKFDDEQLAQYRNQMVGFIFQFHFLLPSMNALNNILLPARIAGQKVDAVRAEGLALAQHLGVDHCLEKYPYQLSGGEQQRIGLIRAVSLRPRLLLCDEPTGNLDSQNSQKVMGILKDLSARLKATLVLVTHDPHVAGQFSRQLFLQDGVLHGA